VTAEKKLCGHAITTARSQTRAAAFKERKGAKREGEEETAPWTGGEDSVKRVQRARMAKAFRKTLKGEPPAVT